MIALDPKRDRQEIIPACDRDLPKEEQTVFVVRPLTVSEDAIVSDLSRYSENGTLQLNGRQKTLLAFRLAVEGVRNLRDSSGNEIPIEREETALGLLVSEKFLSRVGPEIVREVGTAIRNGSTLEGEEAGN